MAAKSTFTFSITSAGLDELRRELNALGSEGKAAFDKLTQTAPQLGQSLDNLGKQAKISFTNMEILRSGAINTFQSLAAGMDPIQVLTTQLAQTAPAFGDVAKAMGLTRLGMIGIGTGAAVALTAIFGVGAAYEKGVGQAQAFNAAQKLTQNAAGLTAGALDAIVKKATDVSSIGVFAARSVATELTATGKLSGDVIGKLTAETADYAAVTKTSVEEAGKALGQIFADPAKGAQQLNAAYNLLSGAETNHIKNLVEQGHVTQVQIELADKLNDRLKGAATDGMGAFERGLMRIKDAASGVADAIAGIGRGPTVEQQLAIIDAQIDKGKNAIPGTGAYLTVQGLKKQRQDLQATKDYQDRKAANDQAYADLVDLSRGAADAADKYATFADKQRQLTNEVQKWHDAVKKFENPNVQFKGPEDAATFQQAADNAKTALAGAQRALAALKTPVGQAQEALANQIAADRAPVSQRAAILARANAETQARQNPVNTEADVKALGDVAATGAIEQQNTALRDRNMQIGKSIELTNAAADAWMKSETAGKEADAQREATLNAMNTGASVTHEKLLILQQDWSKAVEQGSQQFQALNQQIAEQQKVLDAASQSRQAETQAVLDNQIAEKTKDMRVALQQAITAGDVEQATRLRDAIKGVSDEMATLATGSKALDLTHSIQDQQDQISLLQTQLSLVGQSNDAQAQGLAVAQAKIVALREGNGEITKEGQLYIDNAALLAKMTAELQRQQAIAQELPNFFDKAFNDITQGLANLSLKSGNALSGLKNTASAFLSEVISEVTKLSLINPFKNWVMGTNQNPTLVSMGQYYTGAQGNNNSSSGSGGVLGTVMGIFSQLQQSGQGMMSQGMGGGGGMFGGGSGGGMFSGFGNMFQSQSGGASQFFSTSNGQGWLSMFGFGGGSAATAGVRNQATGAFTMAPGGSSGGFSSFMGSGVGSGIASGLISGASTYLSGGSAGQSLGTGIGGLVGGIAGRYWGAVGSMIGSSIGSLLGGIVGSLFGANKHNTKRAYGFATTGDAGLFDKSWIVTKHGAKDSEAEQYRSAVLDTLGAVQDSTGLTLPAGVTAYLKSVTKKGKNSKFYSGFGGVEFGDYTDAQSALTALASGALGISASKGTLQGATAAQMEVFSSAYKKKGALTSQDALTKLTGFASFYAQLDQIRTPADSAAKAIRDLNTQMHQQQRAAQDYGVSVERVGQIFKENFNNDIQDQILQLSDAQAYALKQLDLQHAAQVAQAQALGADLVNVEKLYGLQREQILEQGLNSMNDSLRQFFDQITLGTLSELSPDQQLAQAKGRYADVVASGSKADFQDAAQNLLTVARSYYASSGDYSSIFNDVVSQTRILGNIPGFAGGGDFSGGLRIVGENGPELEATGASRLYSTPQTVSLLKQLANGTRKNQSTGEPVTQALLEGLHGHFKDLAGQIRNMRGDLQGLIKVITQNNVYLTYQR